MTVYFMVNSIIKRMVESNTLYLVIKEFNSPKGYLGPDKISAVDCGYVFEDLVRRFNESYGEETAAIVRVAQDVAHRRAIHHAAAAQGVLLGVRVVDILLDVFVQLRCDGHGFPVVYHKVDLHIILTVRQEGADGIHGAFDGAVVGVAVRAGGDEREGDGLHAVAVGKLQAVEIAGVEEHLLAVKAAAPHRAYRVDDPAAGQGHTRG